MKTQLLTANYYKYLFALILLTTSCTKSTNFEIGDPNLPEGYSILKVEIDGIEVQNENLNPKKASAQVINSISNTFTNPIQAKGITCDVQLEPIAPEGAELNPNKKVGAIITQPVAPNVRYRVYVFDKSSGALAASATYIRGQEATGTTLQIQGGKEYTVVAYSINSTSAYPAELENGTNINTAEIVNEDVDLMFSKQDVNVAAQSNNTVKLKFRHQFSQITTTIKLDAATASYSYIRGASGAAYVKPAYSKTRFKVSDGSITGVDEKINGAEVVFPFIPFKNTTTKETSVTTPTIVNSPPTGAMGQMIIEALTIGNVTRSVIVNNLNLTPGVKYNLILTFHVPETTEFSDNPYFHFVDDSTPVGSTYSHTVHLPNPTYGAQIDIWYLDNSFNLNINGVDLFDRELNFEGFPEHDVYFTDNTYYGDRYYEPRGIINVIYRINETAPRQQIPVVRLTIDEHGNLNLFGRKRMTENLRELEIRGVTINPAAKLNLTGNNTLIFTSTRWTITDIEGRIYGIRIK